MKNIMESDLESRKRVYFYFLYFSTDWSMKSAKYEKLLFPMWYIKLENDEFIAFNTESDLK